MGTTIKSASAAAGAATRGTSAKICRLTDRGGDAASADTARNRRLFDTTKSELNAIAPAASIGLSRPYAAIGMSATL